MEDINKPAYCQLNDIVLSQEYILSWWEQLKNWKKADAHDHSHGVVCSEHERFLVMAEPDDVNNIEDILARNREKNAIT